MPTIVFHGDRDNTVTATNGDAIVERALASCAAGDAQPTTIVTAESPATRGHTTTLYADARGRARVEQWVIHGGAHAWSGGDPQGSYTDARGPDASAEMVRFFLAQ
ncbi:MAG: hypothetical protein H7Y61_12935 [Rhizobiales bacterium]|nr:hypothetical protein [Rhizobacter sp.]